MKQLLIWNLYILAGAVVLNLLEPLTRYCRRRWEEFEQRRAAHPEPDPPPPDPPAPPQDQPKGGGALGLVFMLLSLIFVFLNSWVLEGVFSRLLNQPPIEIFRVLLFGITIIVTDLRLLGLTFTVAEVVVAAATAWAWETHRKALFWLTLVPLISLGLLEVGVNFEDKYLIAIEEGLPLPPLVNGLFGTLQAIVSLGMSLVSGYFVIHRFLLPMLNAIGGALAGFGGGVLQMVGRFSLKGFLLKIGAFVDEGFFERLRALDRAMVGLLKRLRPAREVSHA